MQDEGAPPNNGFQPTALHARKSAASRALWLVGWRRRLPRTRAAAEPTRYAASRGEGGDGSVSSWYVQIAQGAWGLWGPLQ